MKTTLERPDKTPAAIAKRRALLDWMDVNNDLEGLPPSTPEANAVHERLIAGELTSNEAIAELKKLHNLV